MAEKAKVETNEAGTDESKVVASAETLEKTESDLLEEAKQAEAEFEKEVKKGKVLLRHSVKNGIVCIGEQVYKAKNYIVAVLPEHVEALVSHGLKLDN